MEILLKKLPNGSLIPLDEEGVEYIAKTKVGRILRASITKPHNVLFHRKWFVLARYAFDVWSDVAPQPVYKGQVVRPSFDRFRRDLTILCGYYDVEFGIRGELRMTAKSISFSRMEEDEFEGLYSKTIDVILGKILNRPDITPSKLRAHVEEVLRFD